MIGQRLRALPQVLRRWWRGRHGPSGPAGPRLLVDISVLARADAGTGIQRVVRAMLTELLVEPPPGMKVCPVVATRRMAYRLVPPGDPLGSPPSGWSRLPPAMAGDIIIFNCMQLNFKLKL